MLPVKHGAVTPNRAQQEVMDAKAGTAGRCGHYKHAQQEGIHAKGCIAGRHACHPPGAGLPGVAKCKGGYLQWSP